MSRRQIILHLIALDIAEHGKLSKHGIRLYVENRISWQAIQPAIRAGQAIYEKRQHGARSGDLSPTEQDEYLRQVRAALGLPLS